MTEGTKATASLDPGQGRRLRHWYDLRSHEKTPMLNSDLDVSRYADELARRGRTQVHDFLQPEAADALHQCLAQDVPWTLAYRDRAGAKVMDHAELAARGEPGEREFLAQLYAEARGAYGFAYESYMMVRAYLEQRDEGLLLHRLLEFLNCPDYLAFARALTGDARVRRMNAQATRYRGGHFLKLHDDFNAEEGRLYAYVINLTREWKADWGGLLQFLDAEGRVIDTLMPRWNSLSIFRVPAPHVVSLVAPWAEGERLAVTGWMLT